MVRPNLRLLGLIVPFLLWTHGVAAAPPTTGTSDAATGSASEDPDPKVQEFQSLGIDKRVTKFSGTVLDVNDRPVPGVQAKLFMDGVLIASAVTEGNGYYDLQAMYDSSVDATVLLWFVAPDRSLTPKELVLQESRSALAQGLISPCVPRAKVLPGRQFRVYLFDSQNRNKELAELNCLP